MIDEQLVRHLEAKSLRYCLIGATALAAHGFARYTADVDLLTMSDAPLDSAFWAPLPVPEIRRADADDPLGGVVRWMGEVPHDLVVGRGPIMRQAVDTAVVVAKVPCRVATPLSLVLLKLLAGGPQDEYDIIGFIDVQRALGTASWESTVAMHLQAHPEVLARWNNLQKRL